MEHIIDAKNQSLGRVASKAAILLRGKGSATFEPNKNPGVRVKITNAIAVEIGEKKLLQKIYVRYSGYPGGIKRESGKQLRAKKGNAELIRRAVYRMLPGNKLRSRIMKNLIISE